MSEPILEACALDAAYGTARTLHDVSFTLAPGERLAIIGRSGSGKSTLGRLLCGLPPAAARVTGRLRWPGGEAPVAMARKAGLTRHVAWLPQEAQASLHPMLRIGSQVRETLRAAGTAGGPAEVADLLGQAGFDPALARRYPHEVSGGQAQRAALACALAQRPAVLVADEPTSALDGTTEAAVLETLLTLTRDNGLALVLITHHIAHAVSLCHRVMVLEQGVVVEEGWARSLAQAPRSEPARRLVTAAGLLQASC